MKRLGRHLVMPDIVEEHFDELDWACEHRETNVFTPDWTLGDLAEHEQRAEAHLDGLRIAGLHGVDLALERLTGGEPWAAMASTWVLVDAGGDEAVSAVWDAIRIADPQVVDGVRLALRHRPIEGYETILRGLLDADEAFRAAAALDVLAFHRADAPVPLQLLRDPDPAVRSVATRAAGRLGPLGEEHLRGLLSAEEDVVRRAALEAATRAGEVDVTVWCRAQCDRDAPAEVAVEFLGMLGDQSDVPRLHELVSDTPVGMCAVNALGALGFVEAVPGLLDLMSDEALGAHATAAYKRITGADDVEGEKPLPPLQSEDDDGAEDNEALPPDPLKAREDWERRGPAMDAGYRWQHGMRVDDARFDSHWGLTLCSRRDAYLRLRARAGADGPDLELEALVARQYREIQVASAGARG